MSKPYASSFFPAQTTFKKFLPYLDESPCLSISEVKSGLIHVFLRKVNEIIKTNLWTFLFLFLTIQQWLPLEHSETQKVKVCMADWFSGTSQSLVQDVSLKVALSFFSQKGSFNCLLVNINHPCSKVIPSPSYRFDSILRCMATSYMGNLQIKHTKPYCFLKCNFVSLNNITEDEKVSWNSPGCVDFGMHSILC